MSGKSEVLDNPFRLPPDDEIFLLREEEKRRKHEEREMKKNQKVWQKTTASCRIPVTKRLVIDRNALGHGGKDGGKDGKGDETDGQKALQGVTRERENTTDFVAKKREMFLVQMSLDVKKAEILKLDEKARAKETALKKSQQMLDEDVTRFDTFLQANDAKAHKAMKHAEEMTKVKQERLQKIKHLRGKIAQIQSEISKYKEQKEECVKFKKFLDSLTPQEWKSKQTETRQKNAEAKKQNWMEKKKKEINSKIAVELAIYEDQLPDPIAEAMRKGAKKLSKREEEMLNVKGEERRQEIETRRRRLKRRYDPGPEALDKEYAENQGEEPTEDDEELYFTEPKHLLEIFTNLEEANLFLIQNAQETEEGMEEVELRFAETRQVMEQRTEALKDNINSLTAQIEERKRKCDHAVMEIEAAKKGKSKEEEEGKKADDPTKEATHTKEPSADDGKEESSQATLLKNLNDQIMGVFQVCGFDTDARDPLQMLGQIEAKLEDLFIVLDFEEGGSLEGRELVGRLEREREKERRERVRQERLELQQRKNEERLKASLARSQAPVHKKTGKQIMFRSQPLEGAEKKVVKEDLDEVQRERDSKLFGIYLDKNGLPHAVKPVLDSV